jgi:hypothetical protein
MPHNQRLQHDAATAIAQASLEVVESCVHPVCHKDAWEEFYRIALAGIEAYCLQQDRLQQRMNPTNN